MANEPQREGKRLALLERLPKGGICAEVGVWEGGFSEVILEVTQPKELHLIDPWSYQPKFNNTAFGKDKNIEKMERLFNTVSDKFKDDPRVVIHRKMSDEALASFPDGYFDWVYLDGNHNFDVVTQDLALSVQKVKPDGFIGGDDLLWKLDEGAPVRTAVRKLKKRLDGQTAFFRMGQQYLFDLHRAS